METKRDSFFLNKKPKPDNKGKQKQNTRQEQFDKNRDIKQEQHKATEKKQNGATEKKQNDATEKKPFDKKTYRLKKYSKKYKLDQWEEQRKKRLIHNYQKELKHDTVSGTYKPISFDEDITDGPVGKYVRHPDIIEKENLAKTTKDPFKKAKEQYNKIKQDKEQKQLEIERIKEERNKKLQEYKKKKHDRFKKLSKKTKRGQPVMTGRLELLLEKIQSK